MSHDDRDRHGIRNTPQRTQTKRVMSAPIPYLREWRHYRTMTQKDLAATVGTSHTAISFYETGSHNPSFRVIHGLAEALGVSVEQLRYERPPVHQDFAPVNTKGN